MSIFQNTSIRKKRSGSDWAAYFVGEAAGDLVRAWFVMLLLGAAHIHISPAIPALGYRETFLGLVLLSLILTDSIASGVKMALREELV